MKLAIVFNTNTGIVDDSPRFAEWEIDVADVLDTEKPFDQEIERLIEATSASLVDQDGGEIRTENVSDGPNSLYDFTRTAIVNHAMTVAQAKLKAFKSQDMVHSCEIPDAIELLQFVKRNAKTVDEGEAEEHA